MQEEGALFSKNKTKLQQKLPQGGKTGRKARTGHRVARQGKATQEQAEQA